MKKVFILLLCIFVATEIKAADTELQDLDAITTPSTDDVFYIVDDPTGTPSSSKITWDNMLSNITKVGTITTGTWSATDIGLATGGTGASLSDPGADRIFFWDDGAGTTTWLVANTGLTISGTNLNIDLGTAIDTSEITNGTIELVDMNNLNTFADEDILTYETDSGGGFEGMTIAELLATTDTDSLSEGSTNLYQLTEEEVEDYVGGMLGGTETHISVTYQDASNDIDFVVDPDSVAGSISAGSYNDDSVQAADIDTINCGTNCTWDATNDEIDVDDAFLSNTGDAGTGNYDFSGADLELPQGQTPDTEGEIDWDGTNDKGQVHDGAGVVTVFAKTKIVFAFNLHDPDSGMDDIKIQFPRAVTITKVTAICTGGTNVVGRLYEVDGDGLDGDAVGVETSDWTFTTSETEDTSFNNAGFDAGDYIQWDTTSVSGSVTNFALIVEGYEQ